MYFRRFYRRVPQVDPLREKFLPHKKNDRDDYSVEVKSQKQPGKISGAGLSEAGYDAQFDGGAKVFSKLDITQSDKTPLGCDDP